MSYLDDYADGWHAGMREGAACFKARLLRAVDNIECSQLGDEEGAEYVLGPDFRPPSEQNIKALRTWLEHFRTEDITDDAR